MSCRNLHDVKTWVCWWVMEEVECVSSAKIIIKGGLKVIQDTFFFVRCQLYANCVHSVIITEKPQTIIFRKEENGSSFSHD